MNRVLFLIGFLSLVILTNAQIPSYYPLSGLQAFYPFTGNANDITPNAANAVVSGAQLTTDRFGNCNEAYSFNGIDQYIGCYSTNLNNLNNFTISFWIKIDEYPMSGSYVFAKGKEEPMYGDRLSWRCYIGGNPYQYIGTDNWFPTRYATTNPYSSNNWIHFVFTNTGTSQKAYINGVLSSSVTQSGTLRINNDSLYIGTRYLFGSKSQYFKGKLDEIVIWNRSLSSTEISSLYLNTSTQSLIENQDTTIQCGSSFMLQAKAGYTYLWTPSLGLSNNTIQNPMVSTKQNTTYVLKATKSGCDTYDTIQINVVQPTISVTRIDTSCAGDSVKLQASGAQSYAWQAHPTLSDTSIATPYAKPTIPTKYKLFATVNGCTVIDSVTIRMISPFTVNATADTSICAGDTLRLQATGASFYAWSPKVFISDTAVYNPKVYPNNISKYYVVGRKGGCNAIDSVAVNINPLPVLNIDDAVLCVPVSGFVPNVLQQANVASVLWNPSTYLNANNVITPTINPTQSIAYGVRAFSANACSVLDSVKITLANGINVFAGVDTALCIGDTIQLMASGAASYTWYPKIAISDTSIVNPKVYPIVTQKYYVTGHAGTCQSTDSIIVVVNSFPSIAIEDTAMCEGASAITARVSSQANISSVLWTPSTYLSNNTVLEPLINPSQTIKYLVKAYSAGGCMAADSVTIQVFGNPQVIASNDTVLCKGDTIQLLATNGLNYSWYPPVAITDSLVAAPKVYPSATQKYYVQSKSGLCQTTDSVLVTVNDVPLLDLEDVLLCEDSMAIVPTVLQQQNISTVKWTPATYLSADDILTPTITALKSINYQVQVTSVGGCTANESIEVLVGNAHASFNFTNNTVLVPVTINTQNYSTPANGSFNWYLNGQFWSNLFEPSTQLVDSGKYLIKLVVTDELGCVDSAWQEIDAKFQQLIFVPNVFTPNGDYVNERFVISVDMNLYKSLTGSVWNRWGQLIAEFDGKKANWWDGKFEGESCADGVYYYMFTTKDLNDLEKSYRGTITILR